MIAENAKPNVNDSLSNWMQQTNQQLNIIIIIQIYAQFWVNVAKHFLWTAERPEFTAPETLRSVNLLFGSPSGLQDRHYSILRQILGQHGTSRKTAQLPRNATSSFRMKFNVLGFGTHLFRISVQFCHQKNRRQKIVFFNPFVKFI